MRATWSWRPLEFPKGGDERESKTNDSAVSVYAVFPHSPLSVKALKYIWSAVVPVGTRLSSSAGLTQVLVLRTGTEKKGVWTEERVNVFENFKKFFDETETPKASGIAVLTDSDDTKSMAQGDYANFRAWSQHPDVERRVREEALRVLGDRDHGLNFAGCCGGPMQFNVTNGPVTTWSLVSDSYRHGARPGGDVD